MSVNPRRKSITSAQNDRRVVHSPTPGASPIKWSR